MMVGSTITKRCIVGALCLLVVIGLAACERPDPDPVAAAPLEILPTAPISPDPVQAPVPIQVDVTIIMPTPAEVSQLFPSSVQIVVVSPTPELEESQIIEPPAPTLTPYPSNYFLGWAWSEGLKFKDNERVFVSDYGAMLWDRPSPEGKRVGLVVGLAEVIIAGQSYCGYTPVLTHKGNMLSMTSQKPEILEPEIHSEQPDFPAPLFAVEEGTTSGWAYVGAVKITEDVAVPGSLGINLRQDPCRYAPILGLVYADGPMIITGPQSGEYIPVRVANEVIQLATDAILPLQFEPVARGLVVEIQPTPTRALSSP
jgi:hypothetical protein